MSEQDPEEPHGEQPHSKRKQFRSFLQAGISKGYARGKEEAMRGRFYLEHKAGLGHQPNVVPPGEPSIAHPHRNVELGWHPVGGLAGKWFAEETGLGRMITEKINHYPDPTQHWAVLVGDYGHELWMDEHFDVIYINEKIERAEWQTFKVGRTSFNDQALREAGELVIHNMRSQKAAYNLISNNCQNFAMLLLEAIQVGKHSGIATTKTVYETAFGPGKLAELFPAADSGKLAEKPENPALAIAEGEQEHQSVMAHAQQVMTDNTTSISVHYPR